MVDREAAKMESSDVKVGTSNMLKLSSGIERDQKGHFLLEEDGLRRIVEVIEAKSKSLPQKTAIVYFVRRKDDRFYETSDLNDVLADPNNSNRRIEHLSIELRRTDPTQPIEAWERNWIVNVTFTIEKESRVKFTIASDDRNWSLLLADALEPQVARTRGAQQVPSLLLLVFYAALAAFLYAGVPRLQSGLGLYWEAAKNFEGLALMGLVFVALGSVGERNYFVAKIFGPESCFSWGEEAKVREKRLEWRKNVTWAIVIGFFVSVASTVYTNIVFPSAPTEVQGRK